MPAAAIRTSCPPGNGAGALFTGGNVTFAPVPRSGIVAALDVTTNKIVWRFRWADQCYSGLLATGGSLLFVGRADGRLTALDSTTGTQLWEFQTGAGMHAPVSTFERNGKQYVIAYSAGSALIGSARGDSVWLFALDGKLPPATAGRAVSRLEGAANPAPAAANPRQSQRIPRRGSPLPLRQRSPPRILSAVRSCAGRPALSATARMARADTESAPR